MPRRKYLLPVSTPAGIVAVALALVAVVRGSSAAGGRDADIAEASGGVAATSAVRTVVAAGDISPPWLGTQKSTSDLVLRLAPTRVLTLGDEQYDSGRLADYRAFYGPTWGRFKTKTSPTPGNHEYYTPEAAGYFSYLGPAAGRPGRGYYSFDLGGWHIAVSLNSNIARGSRSPQESWLRTTLAAASKRCVLAYWHHPRFSSGATYGNNATVAAFWTDLYAARADLVLNGHEHHYERFGPQTPNAVADPRGSREFVVGTGGARPYPFGVVKANSQKRIVGRYGVLHLTLGRTSYAWKFVAVDRPGARPRRSRGLPLRSTRARPTDSSAAIGRRATPVVSR